MDVVSLKTGETKMAENKAPVYEVRAGSIKASVWENENETKDGKKYKNYSVTPSRSYKDKDGNWKEAKGYNTSDIPKIVSCMNRAYEWIISQKKDTQE